MTPDFDGSAGRFALQAEKQPQHLLGAVDPIRPEQTESADEPLR